MQGRLSGAENASFNRCLADDLRRPHFKGCKISRFIIALLLLLPVQQASAECRSTANRAGCTTPNGAVGVGPNGAATIKTQGKSAPRSPITIIDQAKSYSGTHVQGAGGNSATKADGAGLRLR